MSEPVLLVTGQTYFVRNELKALGGWWHPEGRGWVVPHTAANAVEKLALRRELTVETLDAAPVTTMLAVTGNTYAFRSELFGLGGRWSRPRKAWLFPGREREAVERFALKRGLPVQEITLGAMPVPQAGESSGVGKNTDSARARETTTLAHDERHHTSETPQDLLWDGLRTRASEPDSWRVCQFVNGRGLVPVRELDAAYRTRVGKEQILADIHSTPVPFAIFDHQGAVIAESPSWRSDQGGALDALVTKRGWVGYYIDSQGAIHYTREAYPTAGAAFAVVQPLRDADSPLPSETPTLEPHDIPSSLAGQEESAYEGEDLGLLLQEVEKQLRSYTEAARNCEAQLRQLHGKHGEPTKRAKDLEEALATFRKSYADALSEVGDAAGSAIALEMGALVEARAREVEAARAERRQSSTQPFGDVPVRDENRFYGSIVRVPVRTDEGVEYHETTVVRVLNRGSLIETRSVFAPDDHLVSHRVPADEIQVVRVVDGHLPHLLRSADRLVGPVENYHVVAIRPPYLLVENSRPEVPIPRMREGVTPDHLLFLRVEGESPDQTARCVFRVSGDLKTPDQVDAPELLAELRECFKDEVDLWRIPEPTPEEAKAAPEPASVAPEAEPVATPAEEPKASKDLEGWTLERFDPETYKPRRLTERALEALAQGKDPDEPASRSVHDGWYVGEFDGQKVFTDKRVLLVGSPPGGPLSPTPAPGAETIQSIVTPAEADAVEVVPRAVGRRPKEGTAFVWLCESPVNVVHPVRLTVNAVRFDLARKQVPTARYYHNGAERSPLVIRNGTGRFAGLLQPMDFYLPESVLARLESWHTPAPAQVGESAPRPAGRDEEDGLRPGTRELIDAVSERLSRAEALDNPGLDRLARKCFGGSRGQGRYELRDAYDAVEAAVNRWILREGPRLLAGDPRAVLGELRDLVSRLPRQADRTHEQVEFQQFSTPPTHAFVATKALGVRPGDVILEPSAGVGSLAVWARAAGAEVHTNEVAPRRLALLRELGFTPTAHDGEQIDNLLPEELRASAVLMNPPFTATGGRVHRHDNRFGLRHLEQALQRLEKGGRLVAIMGRGVALDRSKARAWWAETIAEHTLLANLGLPGADYGKYGTAFEQQLVVLDKSGPTPGDNFSERLKAVRWGSVPSLEEALDVVGEFGRGREELAGPAIPAPVRGPVAEPPGQAPSDLGRTRATAAVGDGGTRPRGVSARPAGPSQGDPVVGEAPDVPHGEPGLQPDAGGDGRSPGRDQTDPRHADGGTGGVAQPPATPGAPVVREDEEGGVFVRYAPQRLSREGLTLHPADIVESASMAAIEPPPITYRSALPEEILREGRLSDIQYESVLYAGQRHQQALAGGARAGYFIGDGTGVGKGRILAGAILDNWHQGRQRALWVSTSTDLIEDARRDLTDVAGAGIVPIKRINDYTAVERIALERGVIFTTYSSLCASSKGRDDQPGRSRREQLEEWLREVDGGAVVIFDEAHRAKNAYAGERGQPSKTGQEVLALQRNLPEARVLYSSATGATEVRNMNYMTRLGLWGEKSAFPGGFPEFMSEIDEGGVGARELVARELKALGIYNSRAVSFRGVEYREAFQMLTPEQREIYNLAARAWQVVLQNFDAALKKTDANRAAKRDAMTRFWGEQQRFFRLLLASLKVPAAIREAEAALAEGKSVVIGLFGTGEAVTMRQIAKAKAEALSLDDLDFTPRQVIGDLVDKCFPTVQYHEVTNPDTGEKAWEPALDAKGKPVESREALKMKAKLLDELSGLRFPGNPLDQLVEHFGEKAVAELTGRKKRLLVDPRTGKMRYANRAPQGIPMEKVNLHEMGLFQKGKKRLAIISDAASTGISLHASHRCDNQQRRCHITLELGWSADKQLQAFGRTHRSDQAVAPEYVLLSTDLGGERRFVSTIARRLGSLGALTKGQHDAAGGGDMARFNVETDEGRAAVMDLLTRMERGGDDIPGIEDPRAVLRQMGLLRKDPECEWKECVRDEDKGNVTRFLNRLLALEVEPQNALFEEFFRTFERCVEHAREQGMLDLGVEDLRALEVHLVDATTVHHDRATGATTEHFVLAADYPTHPVTWSQVEQIKAKAPQRASERGVKPGFYRQQRSGRVVFAEPTSSRTDAAIGTVLDRVAITSPRHLREELVDEQVFAERWEPIKLAEAREAWGQALAKVPSVETRQMHIIGGAILPLWQRLKVAEAQRLRIMRTTTSAGRRIVGIAIPEAQVGKVLEAIGISRSHKTPEDVYRAAWREGEVIELVGGLRLQRTRVHNEDRLEVRGANEHKYSQLRSMGMIEENIYYESRFFVPTDDERGVDVLAKLLEEYPSVRGHKTPEAPSRQDGGFHFESWLGTAMGRAR